MPPFLIRSIRAVFVIFLGFASGLPLALTGQSMQAWLTVEGVSLTDIGFLALVGLPYTLKFLWAPLFDRYQLPGLSRRRGWLLIIQLLLALVLLLLSQLSPASQIGLFAVGALLLAFLSASQDVVIDAYRTEMVGERSRGLAGSVHVFGYRLALILSGGIAFIWADPQQGGMGWGEIYRIMALLMLVFAGISLFLLPRLDAVEVSWKGSVKGELQGLLGLVAIAWVAYLFYGYALQPALLWFFKTCFGVAEASKLMANWVNVVALFSLLAITVPLSWRWIQRSGFEGLQRALNSFLEMPQAIAILCFIVFYKLGDAFAGSLLTTFLLKGAALGQGFSPAEIGVANKIFGLWLTIFGAIFGGFLMIRLGLYRALLWFGVLQLVSNVGYYFLAVAARGLWGEIHIPAFDWVIVSLKEGSPVDMMLVAAIAFENLSGGAGTAAFVALLMSLCRAPFTATQYALLSAVAAVGRVWVGPSAGVMAEQFGWPDFFLVSMVLALPGLWLLLRLRHNPVMAKT